MRRGSFLSPYARAAYWTGRFDLSDTVLGRCAAGDAAFILMMVRLAQT